MDMNRKSSAIILLFLLISLVGSGFSSVECNAATTAQDVLSKAVAKINSAKGISCSFTISLNGKGTKGILKAAGNKFAITTPSYSSWYDGSKMWTYNSSTQETTLVKPSASELAETNPLCYLRNYSKSFKAAFAKTKQQGKHILLLTPLKRNLGIKTITLHISTKSGLPERMKINMSNGTSTDIALSNIKCGVSLPAATFIYPAKKYPKAEIVDLR